MWPFSRKVTKALDLDPVYRGDVERVTGGPRRVRYTQATILADLAPTYDDQR